MGIIGYVSVCVLLYCTLVFSLLDSFSTCFGLLGHLQVCTYLLIFKESAFFFYVVALCMFLVCVLFLCCFSFVFFVASCVRVSCLHVEGDITYNTHWTIQCSRMLKCTCSIISVKSCYWQGRDISHKARIASNPTCPYDTLALMFLLIEAPPPPQASVNKEKATWRLQQWKQTRINNSNACLLSVGSSRHWKRLWGRVN
jgi:hypothetical protein